MDEKPEIMTVVVYGSISVAIVSLLSLGGAVIVPLLATDSKHRWLHFFLALAVSTLSCDAILHIIPQVIGVHSHTHSHSHNHSIEVHHHHNHNNSTIPHVHSHEHHDNSTDIDNHLKVKRHADHDDHDDHEDITWLTITKNREILLRLSVVVLAIYTLYFIEFFIFYGKPHAPTIRSQESDSSENSQNENIETNNNDEPKIISKRSNCGHELVNIKQYENDDGGEMCGLKSRALIILFGDGIHNLVDGIAIGASFMMSIRLGVITTIAVVCHELPHEIGDMAVLLDSGLSMFKALSLNFLSALTAFIGLFISIWLGTNEFAENILLAITAGMFLYVAWVDMLSHLKHDSALRDHWSVTCILQFSGFMLGFLLIFSLGWFEELFHNH